MATVIRERQTAVSKLPKKLFDILPPELYFLLAELSRTGLPIDELRLRTGRRVFVTSRGESVGVPYIIGREQMDDVVDRVCGGSLYAHADTIRQGYVTLDGGIRVGIVGRAAVEGERVIGVYDVSALCIRLPRRTRRVGQPVCELVRELRADAGVLVYSPPAEGKTTLLRSVIETLSSGNSALRVAAVDTRGELGAMLDGEELCADVLSGYPKPLGIEIAARCMNAQLIVCDEIGDVDEARAIIAAQNCGAALLATAHASSVEGLLMRTGIAMLHAAHVFGAYVGIRRDGTGRDYEYTVTRYGEADRYFQSIGSGDSRA